MLEKRNVQGCCPRSVRRCHGAARQRQRCARRKAFSFWAGRIRL